MDERLLTREEAAQLCGLKPRSYSDWVRRGLMPKALKGTRRYSLTLIEAALIKMSNTRLPRVTEKPTVVDPWAEWDRENAQSTTRARKTKISGS